jgi:DNA polymerase-3 subunit delta
MVYFFYGAEPFLLGQKVNKEIERYRAKHKSGMNFGRFDFAQEGGFENLKNFISVYSMFLEKKLAIIENLFDASPVIQEKFVQYLEAGNLAKDEEGFLIIVQELRLNEEKKAKEKYVLKNFSRELFKKLTSKTINSEEFNSLSGVRLEAWIKNEVAAQGAKIELPAIKKLAAAVGSDLWQMTNEINKLTAFSGQKAVIKDQDIDNLVKARIESDVFKTIDALAARQKVAAFKFLYRNLTQGESEISLLGMLAYQFRNLVLVKSQLEQGVPFYGLQNKLKMHPFVLRKTFEQSKNFSYAALKKIYERLAEIDLAIKSGQVEPRAALDLVVAEIAG